MIEKMASQTKDIANLFDKISIESGDKFHCLMKSDNGQ